MNEPYVPATNEIANEPQNAALAPQASQPAPAPLPAEKADALTALGCLLLGYVYTYCWGSIAFGHAPPLMFYLLLFGYTGLTLANIYLKRMTPPRESWFWLAVMLCLALPEPWAQLAFTSSFWNSLLLHGVVLYWTLMVTGCITETSGFAARDILAALFVVPFGNFFNLPRVLFRQLRTVKSGNALLVAGSLVVALPLLGIVILLLGEADVGFYQLTGVISEWFDRLFGEEQVMRVLLSLPVAGVLYGALHGGLHHRSAKSYSHDTPMALTGVLPAAAPCAALYAFNAVYALFIGVQGSYLFSSFWGRLPEGWTYSGYARAGFFQLCAVAAVNIALLALARHLTKQPTAPLRIGTTIFCGLSLLLAVTALAKLGMYITAYGLSVLRVKSLLGQLWLVFVFSLFLIAQWREIKVARPVLLSGAGLAAVLSIVPWTLFLP